MTMLPDPFPRPVSEDEQVCAFAPAALTFTAYVSDPELAKDLEILFDCPGTQRQAVLDGQDTPAGWWARAALAYPACADDPGGDLARRACELTAASLAEAVPS